MKLYFHPENKWCLILEDDNDPKKKYYTAIPPCDGDRTDIIDLSFMHYGSDSTDKYIHFTKYNYFYRIKGIIIRIRNGTPSAELIEI